MKRCIALLCLLLVGVSTHISIAQAVSRTYTWQLDTVYSRYEIFITTQDDWITDTAVDVVIRLTLKYKHWSLDYTKTNWMQVVIKSPNFILDSGRQEEQVTLTNIGDYWEKTIPMQISSSKLEQGESVTISLEFTINIDEKDTVQHRWWNHVCQSSDDPIYANVYRPTFWQTTAGILTIGVIIVVGAVLTIMGTIFYRKRKKTLPAETVTKAT